MANDIGSFVVNIQAKIEGYQGEIAKIKSALESVGKDTKIGKDLGKQLQQVESMVDSLSRKMTQRISSESQITRLVDQLNNVDGAFMKIGQRMQSLTFEDLDMQKYSQQIAGAVKELQGLQEQAVKVATTDFSQTLTNYMEKFEKFKQVITELNIDPESLNLNNFEQAFKEALDSSKEKVKDLKSELADLKKQQEEYQNTAKQATQNADFNPKSIVDQVLSQYSDGIRTLSTQKVEKLQSGINKWLEDMNLKDSKLKETIQQQIADAFDIEKSPNLLVSIQNLPKQIGTLLEQAKIGGVKSFYNQLGQAMGVGENGGTSLFTNLNLTEVDTTKLQEVKEAIASIFDTVAQRGLSAEDAAKATEAALKQFTDGAPANGINEVTDALDRLHQTLTNLANDSTLQADKLQPQIDQLNESIKAQEKRNRSAQMSFQNFGSSKEVVALRQENEQLKEEAKNSKAEFENFKAQYANQARGTGSGIERSGAEGLRENNVLLQQYEAELDQVKAKEQMIGKLQGVVQQWFSIYTAIRMVRQAINSIISTIQELDKTITEIAIVTDMTQSDLWGQMSSYTDMARQYASSISGVYQVSQLYYQQGLQTADVMALTEQTLKMARISGLDYAEATDFMTNAIRSFKMEMTDAQRVVDVYSAIAASSATSTTELATAMSKTASSAEAVGSSFENTTAMMAVMINKSVPYVA